MADDRPKTAAARVRAWGSGRRRVLASLSAILAAPALACGWGGSGASAPAVGGPFRLMDQNGVTRDQGILKGKWSAVYFGYTFCPDVCPTTLAALGTAQGYLGVLAQRFQVIFITVDPARDTPAQLRAYLANPAFPKAMIGLTGSTAAIAKVAGAYHVYYRKAGAGRDYSVDHTSVVYLMNPSGGFDRPLDVSAPPVQIAAQISAAMRG